MRFALATEAQEPELRRLLAADPMPGPFRLIYARDPDFRQALGVQGTTTQVLAALEGDRVVGMGVRAILPVHLNGKPREVGYLGGLRSLLSARRGLGLAKGFRFLRDLHGDGRVPGYLTTILEGNPEAMDLLRSRRAGLPHYLDLGRFLTCALLPSRRRGPVRDFEILRPPQVPLPEVLAFLREQARLRPFGAVFGEDLTGPWFRGFREEDCFVAQRNGVILGVVGAWDQSAYKQVRVAGYAPWLRLARPVLNLALGAAGWPRLPQPGRPVPQKTLAFIAIREDDPGVFRALVQAVLREQRGFLTVGLHERDPLRAGLRGLPGIPYASRLFWVCWEEGLDTFRGLDLERAPMLELARL